MIVRIRRSIEKKILIMIERILPSAPYDRLIIWWRRKVNGIKESYPYAKVYSHKKSKYKYCVVRYTIPTMSIFAAGIQFLFKYYWLVNRGYVPIIDIEYTYSYKQGRLGENNIWDMCFEQPIPAKNLVNQPYVICIGEGFNPPNDPRLCMDLNGDEKDHFIHVRKENFKEYYAKAKKYVEPLWQIRDNILKEYDDEIGIKLQGSRVLGVFLREEFSEDTQLVHEGKAKRIYENHPLLPSVKETIEIIKDKKKEWKFDLIFVASMCQDSIDIFQQEFGDVVLCVQRNRITFEELKRRKMVFEKEEEELYRDTATDEMRESEYKKDITYLKEIIALSQCNYFIGGASSGAAIALTMNGGEYEDIYLLEDIRKINRY